MANQPSMEVEEAIALAPYLEHTNLKPYIVQEQVETLCQEANEHGFVGVCIPPYYVQAAANAIGKKSSVKIVTVVGFPFGYTAVPSKVEAAKKAIIAGAHEIDMVMNIAAFKSKDWAYVKNDIESVATACHLQNGKVKVIIETAYLDDDEIVKACKVSADCGADFIKTSTGYAPEGATVHAVELMRKSLPKSIEIKAAGGIKSAAFAHELIKAGATRIGTSSAVELVK